MNKLSLSTVLWLGIAAVGCGDNQDPGGARELWTQIHELDYRSWQRAPGYAERRASNAPHSDAVEIFVNDVVTQALSAGPAASWPVGSLIVKDGWDGETLQLVAVMEKRASGWYWAEYDGSGDAAYSGSPTLCIDCHRSGADFVRAFGLPVP
jgi:Cytochrome P460